MKKIVAFVGSPRRNGNVSSIISEMLRGAKEMGAEAKVYFLNEMSIKGCQSCLYCREKGECRLDDDMSEVYENVKEADTIIIGSPIYICQVSAQTKLLLDRLYPLTDKSHKPRFGTRKLVMVYTQAAPMPFIFRKYIKYNQKILKPMGLVTIKNFIATKAFTADASRKNMKLMKRAYVFGKKIACV